VVVTARQLAESLAAHLGFPVVSAAPIPAVEDICCGDPCNLDGNAHPWSEVGEDQRGTHYRCLVCGAEDTD
jgi:hypothetical protein